MCKQERGHNVDPRDSVASDCGPVLEEVHERMTEDPWLKPASLIHWYAGICRYASLPPDMSVGGLPQCLEEVPGILP